MVGRGVCRGFGVAGARIRPVSRVFAIFPNHRRYSKAPVKRVFTVQTDTETLDFCSERCLLKFFDDRVVLNAALEGR